ncbi:MAG: hypothetical protein GTO45_26875 [Candidatus Aminicenantes bacterium]|nr:hypothetical protein [Candidatus Aminicenantes bacterium]NIR09246.1 hypothetical protein [Candidatus Aminicenantes bacterium]NIT26772.1 hypothetical protein [Candidatus Aminicenantes bacterium]
MKTSMILCMMCLVLFPIVYLYPEVLTNFPDMGKPYELRIDGGYIYITDQYSVLVYDINTFKLEKRLGNKGEGPQEFKNYPKITFTSDRLILCDIYKIIIYSKDFKLIREINLHFKADRVIPIEDNFILRISKIIDNKEYTAFMLYNSNLEEIKDLVIEPPDPGVYEFLITPWTVCRSWDDKVFISRPKKGFYIEVFNKNGEKLYQIEKNVENIKSGEKHRKLYMDEILYFVGRRRFERARERGIFKKPMREFLPSIGNFWVLEDKIYVKTYDITETKQKYIIMDLKGNILKTVFLPKVYWEILTFSKNKFYYLEDREEEGWVLQALDLPR